MLLFAGLGNPGRKYLRNRHNVGFMALDRIAERHAFPAWSRKYQGLTSSGRLGGAQVLLLKPSTFMNESGRSVGAAARFFRIKPQDIIVFHDEIDLAPGKMRLKTGGGTAGHNGLRSIDRHLGKGFRRVRIGVGHPGSKHLVTPYVLGNFSRADGDWLEPTLDAIARGAPSLATGDDAGFLNARQIGRNRPDRHSTEASDPSPGARPAGDRRPPTAPLPLGTKLSQLIDRFRR